jgi:branched-chain amino acid aminotransferase
MLYMADEIFFTGTAAEVTPVRSVDKIKIGNGRPGQVTQQLQQRFLDIARGIAPDSHGWLTFVRAERAASRS